MEQHILGGGAALSVKAGQHGFPLVDPGAVAGDQRRQRPFGGAAVGQAAKGGHVGLHPRHVHRFDLLHLRGRNPGGAEQAAGTVDQLPVGGDAVTGGVFGRAGVVEVGHCLIAVVAGAAARVGPGDERKRAAHLQLGLKGERLVGAVVGGRPFVHQKQRHRARSRRQPAGKAGGIHRPGDRVQDQSVRAGHRVRLAPACRQRHPDGCLAGRPLPPLRGVVPPRRLRRLAAAVCLRLLAVPGAVLDVPGAVLDVPVVAPANGYVELARVPCNQEAQADRRREEPLPGGLTLLGGVVTEPGLVRNLRLEVVVGIVVGALLGPRAARDQKPRQIPARRPHPPRQPFVRQGVAGVGADQVERQRPPQPGTHIDRFGHRRQSIAPKRQPRGAGASSITTP